MQSHLTRLPYQDPSEVVLDYKKYAIKGSGLDISQGWPQSPVAVPTCPSGLLFIPLLVPLPLYQKNRAKQRGNLGKVSHTAALYHCT